MHPINFTASSSSTIVGSEEQDPNLLLKQEITQLCSKVLNNNPLDQSEAKLTLKQIQSIPTSENELFEFLLDIVMKSEDLDLTPYAFLLKHLSLTHRFKIAEECLYKDYNVLCGHLKYFAFSEDQTLDFLKVFVDIYWESEGTLTDFPFTEIFDYFILPSQQKNAFFKWGLEKHKNIFFLALEGFDMKDKQLLFVSLLSDETSRKIITPYLTAFNFEQFKLFSLTKEMLSSLKENQTRKFFYDFFWHCYVRDDYNYFNKDQLFDLLIIIIGKDLSLLDEKIIGICNKKEKIYLANFCLQKFSLEQVHHLIPLWNLSIKERLDLAKNYKNPTELIDYLSFFDLSFEDHFTLIIDCLEFSIKNKDFSFIPYLSNSLSDLYFFKEINNENRIDKINKNQINYIFLRFLKNSENPQEILEIINLALDRAESLFDQVRILFIISIGLCFIKDYDKNQINLDKQRFLLNKETLNAIFAIPNNKTLIKALYLFSHLPVKSLSQDISQNAPDRTFYGPLYDLGKNALSTVNFEQEDIEKIFSFFFFNKKIRIESLTSNKKIQQPINLFYYLLMSNELSQENKNNLLKSILKNRDTAFKKIESFILLCSLQGLEELKILLDKQPLLMDDVDALRPLIYSRFKQLVPFDSQKDSDEKFVKAFKERALENELIAYAAELSTSNNEKPLELLKTFITWVLEGTFTHNRYLQDAHLKECFQNNPELEKNWSLEKRIPLIIPDSSSEQFNPLGFLKIKLLQEAYLDLSALPYLKEYLENSIQPEEALKKIEAQFSKDNNAKTINNLELQKKLILFSLAASNKKVNGYISEILYLLKSYQQGEEFSKELKALLSKEKNVQNLFLVKTDDYSHLLLSGTSVQGSCLSVYGDIKQNLGLLGQLLNGHNMILAVVDAKGNLLERMFLRLVTDKNLSPVFLLEKHYSSFLKSLYKKELTHFAIEIAKELQVDLVKGEGTERYPKTLHVHETIAPEYSDTAKGLQSNEGYRIKKTFSIK